MGVTPCPFSGVVVPYQPLCHLKPKLFESKLGHARVVLVQYICISQAYLKEEPKDVPIELAALESDMVVLAELVIPVHPTHVPVVQVHRFRTGDISSAPITLSALYRGVVLRLCICREQSDNMIVFPQNGSHVPILHNL